MPDTSFPSTLVIHTAGYDESSTSAALNRNNNNNNSRRSTPLRASRALSSPHQPPNSSVGGGGGAHSNAIEEARAGIIQIVRPLLPSSSAPNQSNHEGGVSSNNNSINNNSNHSRQRSPAAGAEEKSASFVNINNMRSVELFQIAMPFATADTSPIAVAAAAAASQRLGLSRGGGGGGKSFASSASFVHAATQDPDPRRPNLSPRPLRRSPQRSGGGAGGGGASSPSPPPSASRDEASAIFNGTSNGDDDTTEEEALIAGGGFIPKSFQPTALSPADEVASPLSFTNSQARRAASPSPPSHHHQSEGPTALQQNHRTITAEEQRRLREHLEVLRPSVAGSVSLLEGIDPLLLSAARADRRNLSHAHDARNTAGGSKNIVGGGSGGGDGGDGNIAIAPTLSEMRYSNLNMNVLLSGTIREFKRRPPHAHRGTTAIGERDPNNPAPFVSPFKKSAAKTNVDVRKEEGERESDGIDNGTDGGAGNTENATADADNPNSLPSSDSNKLDNYPNANKHYNKDIILAPALDTVFIRRHAHEITRHHTFLPQAELLRRQKIKADREAVLLDQQRRQHAAVARMARRQQRASGGGRGVRLTGSALNANRFASAAAMMTGALGIGIGAGASSGGGSLTSPSSSYISGITGIAGLGGADAAEAVAKERRLLIEKQIRIVMKGAEHEFALQLALDEEEAEEDRRRAAAAAAANVAKRKDGRGREENEDEDEDEKGTAAEPTGSITESAYASLQNSGAIVIKGFPAGKFSVKNQRRHSLLGTKKGRLLMGIPSADALVDTSQLRTRAMDDPHFVRKMAAKNQQQKNQNQNDHSAGFNSGDDERNDDEQPPTLAAAAAESNDTRRSPSPLSFKEKGLPSANGGRRPNTSGAAQQQPPLSSSGPTTMATTPAISIWQSFTAGLRTQQALLNNNGGGSAAASTRARSRSRSRSMGAATTSATARSASSGTSAFGWGGRRAGSTATSVSSMDAKLRYLDEDGNDARSSAFVVPTSRNLILTADTLQDRIMQEWGYSYAKEEESNGDGGVGGETAAAAGASRPSTAQAQKQQRPLTATAVADIVAGGGTSLKNFRNVATAHKTHKAAFNQWMAPRTPRPPPPSRSSVVGPLAGTAAGGAAASGDGEDNAVDSVTNSASRGALGMGMGAADQSTAVNTINLDDLNATRLGGRMGASGPAGAAGGGVVGNSNALKSNTGVEGSGVPAATPIPGLKKPHPPPSASHGLAQFDKIGTDTPTPQRDTFHLTSANVPDSGNSNHQNQQQQQQGEGGVDDPNGASFRFNVKSNQLMAKRPPIRRWGDERAAKLPPEAKGRLGEDQLFYNPTEALLDARAKREEEAAATKATGIRPVASSKRDAMAILTEVKALDDHRIRADERQIDIINARNRRFNAGGRSNFLLFEENGYGSTSTGAGGKLGGETDDDDNGAESNDGDGNGRPYNSGRNTNARPRTAGTSSIPRPPSANPTAKFVQTTHGVPLGSTVRESIRKANANTIFSKAVGADPPATATVNIGPRVDPNVVLKWQLRFQNAKVSGDDALGAILSARDAHRSVVASAEGELSKLAAKCEAGVFDAGLGGVGGGGAKPFVVGRSASVSPFESVDGEGVDGEEKAKKRADTAALAPPPFGGRKINYRTYDYMNNGNIPSLAPSPTAGAAASRPASSSAALVGGNSGGRLSSATNSVAAHSVASTSARRQSSNNTKQHRGGNADGEASSTSHYRHRYASEKAREEALGLTSALRRPQSSGSQYNQQQYSGSDGEGSPSRRRQRGGVAFDESHAIVAKATLEAQRRANARKPHIAGRQITNMWTEHCRGIALRAAEDKIRGEVRVLLIEFLERLTGQWQHAQLNTASSQSADNAAIPPSQQKSGGIGVDVYPNPRRPSASHHGPTPIGRRSSLQVGGSGGTPSSTRNNSLSGNPLSMLVAVPAGGQQRPRGVLKGGSLYQPQSPATSPTQAQPLGAGTGGAASRRSSAAVSILEDPTAVLLGGSSPATSVSRGAGAPMRRRSSAAVSSLSGPSHFVRFADDGKNSSDGGGGHSFSSLSMSAAGAGAAAAASSGHHNDRNVGVYFSPLSTSISPPTWPSEADDSCVNATNNGTLLALHTLPPLKRLQNSLVRLKTDEGRAIVTAIFDGLSSADEGGFFPSVWESDMHDVGNGVVLRRESIALIQSIFSPDKERGDSGGGGRKGKAGGRSGSSVASSSSSPHRRRGGGGGSGSNNGTPQRHLRRTSTLLLANAGAVGTPKGRSMLLSPTVMRLNQWAETNTSEEERRGSYDSDDRGGSRASSTSTSARKATAASGAAGAGKADDGHRDFNYYRNLALRDQYLRREERAAEAARRQAEDRKKRLQQYKTEQRHQRQYLQHAGGGGVGVGGAGSSSNGTALYAYTPRRRKGETAEEEEQRRARTASRNGTGAFGGRGGASKSAGKGGGSKAFSVKNSQGESVPFTFGTPMGKADGGNGDDEDEDEDEEAFENLEEAEAANKEKGIVIRTLDDVKEIIAICCEPLTEPESVEGKKILSFVLLLLHRSGLLTAANTIAHQ